MKKAFYLVLSLVAVLFLGIVFYESGIAQANDSEAIAEESIVEVETIETGDSVVEIETNEISQPRNNAGRYEDCPRRAEGRDLYEDCPYRENGRRGNGRRMSDDDRGMNRGAGRRMSDDERPCSRGRNTN